MRRSRASNPEQVFKTLVVALPKGLAVAVIPVPSKLSLKAAAAALGVSKATMADRAAAERSTGYVIGGISPFGQRRPLPTVVDASALHWDRVLCSAGKRGWDVAVHPQDLIAAHQRGHRRYPRVLNPAEIRFQYANRGFACHKSDLAPSPLSTRP